MSLDAETIERLNRENTALIVANTRYRVALTEILHQLEAHGDSVLIEVLKPFIQLAHRALRGENGTTNDN